MYKLTDLPLGAKATIRSLRPGFEHVRFTGTVARHSDGGLWITHGNGFGYMLEERYESIWEVESFTLES